MNNTYYIIHIRQRKELGIDSKKHPKAVDVFAIIYGFSQDCKSRFTGDYNYISEMIRTSSRTVKTAVAYLVDIDLIIKIPSKKFMGCNSYFYNSEMVAHNNKDNNKKYIKKIVTNKKTL